LYWDEVLEKLEHAQEFHREDSLEALAIVTNPHLEREHQRRLWTRLQGKKPREVKITSEAELTARLKNRGKRGV